jgi:hypothetical protein
MDSQANLVGWFGSGGSSREFSLPQGLVGREIDWGLDLYGSPNSYPNLKYGVIFSSRKSLSRRLTVFRCYEGFRNTHLGRSTTVFDSFAQGKQPLHHLASRRALIYPSSSMYPRPSTLSSKTLPNSPFSSFTSTSFPTLASASGQRSSLPGSPAELSPFW